MTTGSLFRYTHAVLSPASVERMRHLLDNPRRRSAAARILNDQSRQMLAIESRLIEEDLHRRPENRRSAISLAHGKEVHDSCEIIPAREMGPEKMRVAVRNTHPAFHWLDQGTAAHEIRPRIAKSLVLPFNAGARGSAGVRGAFAVTKADGPIRTPPRVMNPGVNARHFRRRTVERFRRQAKRRLNR